MKAEKFIVIGSPKHLAIDEIVARMHRLAGDSGWPKVEGETNWPEDEPGWPEDEPGWPEVGEQHRG